MEQHKKGGNQSAAGEQGESFSSEVQISARLLVHMCYSFVRVSYISTKIPAQMNSFCARHTITRERKCSRAPLLLFFARFLVGDKLNPRLTMRSNFVDNSSRAVLK